MLVWAAGRNCRAVSTGLRSRRMWWGYFLRNLHWGLCPSTAGGAASGRLSLAPYSHSPRWCCLRAWPPQFVASVPAGINQHHLPLLVHNPEPATSAAKTSICSLTWASTWYLPKVHPLLPLSVRTIKLSDCAGRYRSHLQLPVHNLNLLVQKLESAWHVSFGLFSRTNPDLKWICSCVKLRILLVEHQPTLNLSAQTLDESAYMVEIQIPLQITTHFRVSDLPKLKSARVVFRFSYHKLQPPILRNKTLTSWSRNLNLLTWTSFRFSHKLPPITIECHQTSTLRCLPELKSAHVSFTLSLTQTTSHFSVTRPYSLEDKNLACAHLMQASDSLASHHHHQSFPSASLL